jgi:predicted ester cyclase
MNGENESLVRAYVEAFNCGDFERIAGLCTPDVMIHGVLGHGGLDVAMPIWRDLHHAFGTTLVIDAIVATDNQVAVRYSESGTFRNPFRGMQPTGKSYALVAMEWFEIRDHKIAARWGARDSANLMRQLEAV